VGVGEPVDPLAGGGEQHPVPGLAAADGQPDCQVCFPGAGWAEEDHILLAGDEVEGGQMHYLVAFQTACVVEVELLDAFASREPGGPDPVLAAVGIPGGDLTLQTSRQVLLMAPRFGPGSLGEPARRIPQGGRFQRSSQIGDLAGHIAGGGLCAGHHAIPPSATPNALS
jgi:hypothetical protein